MTKFKEWTNVSDVDLLVGGTPCQSFSVAGLRKGLDDPRGNLMLTYLAIADQYKPKWIVWENVPGVLSSNGGKDFGVFLGALGELGYGFAYRILDAQYFGVAQRRRRVFVVGYLGDWRRAAAVLFERESLSGNPAPSRKKREDPAKCLTRGAGQRYDFETEDLITQPVYEMHGQDSRVRDLGETCSTVTSKFGTGGGNVPVITQPIAYNITFCDANGTRSDRPNGGLYVSETDVSSTMTKAGIGTNVAQPIPLNTMAMQGRPGDKEGRMGSGIGKEGDPCPTLTKAHSHAVAQPIAFDAYNQTTSDTVTALRCAAGGVFDNTVAQPTVVAPTLTAANDPSRSPQSSEVTQQVYSVLQASMAVRRLTPVECERLQGFPDTYTDIMSKGKATPDGPRYKALGNSMAVPVMAWIGKRINEVEQLCKPNK